MALGLSKIYSIIEKYTTLGTLMIKTITVISGVEKIDKYTTFGYFKTCTKTQQPLL